MVLIKTERRNKNLKENEDIRDCVDHAWCVSGSTGKGSAREERAGGHVRFQDENGSIRLRNLRLMHTLKGLGLVCNRETKK